MKTGDPKIEVVKLYARGKRIVALIGVTGEDGVLGTGKDVPEALRSLADQIEKIGLICEL